MPCQCDYTVVDDRCGRRHASQGECAAVRCKCCSSPKGGRRWLCRVRGVAPTPLPVAARTREDGTENCVQRRRASTSATHSHMFNKELLRIGWATDAGSNESARAIRRPRQGTWCASSTDLRPDRRRRGGAVTGACECGTYGHRTDERAAPHAASAQELCTRAHSRPPLPLWGSSVARERAELQRAVPPSFQL
jgi:hypothetical protein